MVGLPEGYPKPRHEYVYRPVPGRGIYHHRNQLPNGAPYSPVVGGAGMGYGLGYGMGYGMGSGLGYGTGLGMGYPGAVHLQNYSNRYGYGYGGIGVGFPYGYNGYYGAFQYANYYNPYQRTPVYYTTTAAAAAIPASTVTYAYPRAANATYTTTAHVASAAIPTAAYVCGRTQSEVQLENRRIATERGAYAPRRIKPADAGPDDPFWCREKNGEWHLRSFYQIENECYPGRWTMDAEIGFLVFHRE
ncbi:hypothetical protein K505DRAFT_411078 [Melanomma pulvis-pyrius CBS 109.77]|uniref:G-patch domain-containing protein n=1 Tax=Melanomma pulvis-pyrius CBS 109.77 TaxID=1314802 RepID=A0A6A6WV14_9PLEO|nr:hypothetical protein K505DRAFT_411078 [Melanomma pulvis-pyrius CBS 109.77]